MLDEHDRNANLIIGCGGTGSKSALRLARLMGDDPGWRSKAPKNFFFFLVDTDQGELDAMAAGIQRAIPDVEVGTYLLTEGFSNPAEIVADFVEGLERLPEEPRLAALSRFLAHWWSQDSQATAIEAARVFTIPHLRNVTTGAGQVPMLSFLAAWRSMQHRGATPSLEDALSSFANRMLQERSTIPQSSNDQAAFNVLLVGSLAGGTGRGCVIPVALKVKEVFAERLRRASGVDISAYLFDASCFAGIQQAQEALAQTMNSMTGWSELSVWADVEEHKRVYALPGIVNMHDPLSDALRSPFAFDADHSQDVENTKLAKPFDGIAIICGRTAGGIDLQDPGAIYEMLGTSLYTRLTKSNIDSKTSNLPSPFSSLGSAVVEVPALEIESYFAARARFDALEALGSRWSEPSARLTEFLAWSGLDDPLVALMDAAPAEREASSAIWRLAAQLAARAERELAGLRAVLEEQDLEGARGVLADLLREARLNDPRFVAEIGRLHVDCLAQEWRARGEDEHVDAPSLLRAVLAGLAAEVLEASGSAAACLETARALGARLTALEQEVLTASGIERWSNAHGAGVQLSASDVLEEVKDKEGLLGLGSLRFTEHEIERVLVATREELMALYARALGASLSQVGAPETALESAWRELTRSLEDGVEVVRSQAAEYRAGLNIDRIELDQRAERLFADPQRLDRALAMGDPVSKARLAIRRVIRPVKPQGDALRLSRRALTEELAALLLPAEGAGPDRSRRIGPALDQCVYELRDEASGAYRPAKQGFGLRDVLRGLRGPWEAFLEHEARRGPDRFADLRRDVRDFFGIDAQLVDGRVDLRTSNPALVEQGGDDFLLLALSIMATRTCRPFWQITSREAPSWIVQVPLELDEDRQGQWRAAIQQGANVSSSTDRKLVDLVSGTRKGMVNPFLVSVYTQEGAEAIDARSALDSIHSLEGWKSDPELMRCLRLAEDPAVPMPFRHGEMWPSYRGSGFTDPVYTTDPFFRTARWRPWLPKEQRDAEAAALAGDDHAGLERLLYALLGPEIWLRAAFGERCLEVLEATGLPGGPVLELRESRRVFYRRVPMVERNDGRPGPTTEDIGFALETNIAKGLTHMEAILAGLAEPVAGGQYAKENARALSRAIDLEYELFRGPIAQAQGFHEVSGRKAHLEMLTALRDRALQERDAIDQKYDSDDRRLWDRCLRMFDQLIEQREAQ